MSKRVALIDDDRFYVSSLVSFLEDEGINVKLINRVDEAFEHLAKDHSKYDKIIVDIMMQVHGDFDVEETEDGMTTGLALIKRLLEIEPSLTQKFLIVSITSNNRIKNMATELGITTLSKQDARPDILLEAL